MQQLKEAKFERACFKVSMFSRLVFLLVLGFSQGFSGKSLKNISEVGICDYQATCSVGGTEGACVSASGGCCPGGTLTQGLCPGSADIQCCTNAQCSTPQGNGVCVSSCSGTSVPGYCAGPSDLECCVGGGCTLGTIDVGPCDSSGPTAGITAQIVAQLNAMGRSFRTLDPSKCHCSGFTCSLQSSAADALEQACDAQGDFITLNSAFRSSAEQFVLYQWYQAGQCGITLAAPPGQSNHEGGRAIDTSYPDYWEPVLAQYGWVHSYPESDPVHFDYPAAADFNSDNLLAFQTLWNNNNPNNQITADGQYGKMTEKALYYTPCGGW